MPPDPYYASNHTVSGGLARPLYFNSDEHCLFGWLHRPAGGSHRGTGVVICKPFGYEAICAHRSTRAFAEVVAELGLPALRFDYHGTGDSSDIDAEADQIEVWTRDIVAAVGELQRLTDVERVCLLGFRLGALLATLAASHCRAVQALALIAPVVSGRRYLRELRMTRLAATLNIDPQVRAAPDSPSVHDSMEVSGFSLSAATLASLAQVDLAPFSAPLPDLLILDNISVPAARGWADTLTAAGVRTDYRVLPGMVEMLMTDPQFAVVPEEALNAVRHWLPTVVVGEAAFSPRGSVEAHMTTAPAVMRLPGDLVPFSTLTERPVTLDAEVSLFGIVTEPRADNKRHRGVILLNVGAEHHIGASRIYVSLARHWARHGYTVLRIDLAGLGDSATRAGRPSGEVFPPAALEDIGAAVDFMRSRYGIEDLTLGGLCSGAYHSLRAAIAGLPVSRILMVNPMNFLWQESLTADHLQADVDVARNVGFYRDRVLSSAIWKRIFTGRFNLWRIVRIAMQRPYLNVESMLHDVARALGIRMPGDLGWELEEIAKRGVKIIFVFARGEPGLDVLKLQAGSSLRQLGDQCLIHIIESADHIFSHAATRELLEQVLSTELFARNPRPAAEGAGSLRL